MRKESTPLAVGFFWHVVFLDILTMFLRFGGLTMLDLAIHGSFLLLAFLCLCFCPGWLRPKSWVLWCCAGAACIGLLQLVPLPGMLFSLLAPVKAQIAAAVQALYPEIDIGRQMTLNPNLHLVQLTVLGLDLWLVLMLALAPPPSLSLVRSWVMVLSLPIGAFGILGGGDLIAPGSWLAPYAATFGGLVNVNHFALTTVVLFLLVAGFLCQLFLKLKRHLQGQVRLDHKRRQQVLIQVMLLIFSAFILLLGFYFAHSRSGILNMALGLGTFGGLIWIYSGKGKVGKQPVKTMLLLAVGLALILVFLPLGRGLEKFDSRGFRQEMRLEVNLVGLRILSEMPLLGCGLGSAESLLGPLAPLTTESALNLREFHNDLLQVGVEYGILALGLWLVCLGFLWRDLFRTLNVKSLGQRLHQCSIIAVVLVITFHSLLSFPLRITAIRVLIVAVVFLGLKRSTSFERSVSKKSFVGWLIPLLLAATWGLVWANRQAYAGPVPADAQSRFALTYGRFFRVSFFEANQRLRDFFQEPFTMENLNRCKREITPKLMIHLEQNPFSLKGLNILFMLEALAEKHQHPQQKGPGYAALKTKAEALRSLGKDRNFQSRASLYFLFSLYQEDLSQEERVFFDRMQQELAKRIRDLPNR